MMWCVRVVVWWWLAGALAAYSSFWRPLVDPRVLGYKVDAAFEPGAAQRARAQYERAYGPRGAHLVAALGAGGPAALPAPQEQMYGDVKLYYTYPGAYNEQA